MALETLEKEKAARAADTKLVQLFFFNGTHGSYRKMARRLYPGRDHSSVSCYLDDKGQGIEWIYWKDGQFTIRKREGFTGIVYFVDGLIMRKGNHYHVPIDD